jgi:Na+/melibiose symporter-like transporter
MASPQKVYAIGTLRYTLGGLVILFSWLLLADFAFSIMELVIPKVLPLTLNEAGASNATIGLIVGTISSLMNLLLNPIISFHSDRHRGRWGRRKPYLIWSAPFISLFLIITGYSTDLGQWIHSVLAGRFGHVSQANAILATIAVAAVVFQFFNMFVRSVYYYLLNDVVPVVMVGRFYALFRVVDAAAGFVFNRYVLGYADNPTTRKWIYISMGIVFLLAFILMCWQVKEGDYPPPEPLGGGTAWQRLAAAIRVYTRECFSIPLYLWLFLGNALYRASEVSVFNFQLLLAKDIGMSLNATGKLLGWVSLAGVILYWPLGWLTDKIQATRLAILSAAMTAIVMILSIWLVRGPTSFSILTLLWTIAWLAYISAVVPLMLYILPRDRYGQFCSANAIFYAIALMVANYGGGLFIDRFGSLWIIRQGTSPYLAIFWWGAACSTLSLFCLVMVYRGWQRHGGRLHYIPPGTLTSLAN